MNKSPTIADPQQSAHWHWLEVLTIGLLTGIFMILGFAIILPFLPSTQVARLSLENPPLQITAALTFLEGLAIILSFAVVLVLRKKSVWSALDLEVPHSTWLFTSVALALAAIPVIGLIMVLVQELLGLPLDNPQLEVLAPENVTLSASLLMLFAGGFLVPVAEEFLFRGLLHRFLRQYWSFLPAAFVSSLIFGLLHGNIAVAAATFSMGMLMVWVYERSGSLWTAIIIHITNNSVKLFLLYAMLLLGFELPAGF